MSQSLHATPTSPHFGFHFDGHMNVKPFALRKEDDEGQILNREKSIAPAASDYDKGGVKVDIISDNLQQQQEKGQGFERKKSLAGEAETDQHEDDHSNDNAFVPPFEVEGIHDPDKCNACRCALGASHKTPAKGYLRRLYNLAKDQPLKPPQRRLPPRPESPPPIDPQKFREILNKNRPYMKQSA